MRQLVLVLVVAATAACASSHTATPNLRQQCEDRYDRVWVATQSALSALDARIVSANRQSGTIHGRIAADAYGSEIELGITVRRTPDSRLDSVEPLWVEVRTWDPATTTPDTFRLQDLEEVARRYLELVRGRASCGPPM